MKKYSNHVIGILKRKVGKLKSRRYGRIK